MTNRRIGLCTYRKVDRRGVSEVIGTILLLAMTVMVFSGIILFVNSLTGPGDETYVNLVPVLERTDPNNGVIAITHAGGHSLDAERTDVLVLVNSTTFPLTVADGLVPIDGRWVTGQRWQVNFAGNQLSENATVQVIVVDQRVNQAVMLAVVQRGVGTGGTFPIVGAMSVLPNGLVYNDGQDAFRLRVVAVDYDNDLPRQGVRVDMSPLGCNVSNQTLVDQGFGIYESPTAKNLTSCVTARTYYLNVTATDMGGHSTTRTMPFKVVKQPSSKVPSSGSGPFGWLFSNEFQAYEIFNETEWEAQRFNGTPTRTFVKGEVVVVIVASQYIKNLDQQNEVRLYSTTRVPVLPIVYGGGALGAATVPSSTDAFSFDEFIGGFFLYEYRFSTGSDAYGFNGTDLEYGRYALEMALRADNVDPPRNRFSTSDVIAVTDAAGNVPAYPALSFYQDSAYTTESNRFHFTDTVYVKVRVKGTDASPTFGDTVLTDYIGGVQIWGQPGTAPISGVTVVDASNYGFSLDLTEPTGDPWVFGTNAYGFEIKQLFDDDERYTLAGQLVIEGPEWGLDIFLALEEYSHPVHAEKWYALMLQNDQVWSQSILERFESAPSQTSPDFGGGKFYDVALGDYDEDGDLDAVYGIEKGRVFLYRNDGGQGLSWDRYEVDNLVSVVWSVAMGRIDADTDLDLAAGTDTGEVWAYDNNGKWTPTLIVDLNTPINQLVLADLTGDGAAELIIGANSGDVRIYINDGYGGFGTLATTDYLLASETAVQGTVSGTYTATQTSNNGYESIREVNGTGLLLQYYYPIGDITAAYDIIEAGSYANLLADDGAPFEVLAEAFYDGPGPNDRWILRNTTGGGAPGHQYALGTIPSLGAGDTAAVTINAFLSAGTEPIEVRFKVGSAGAPSAVLGTISETSETTKTFALTGFTGGELYIILQDSDISFNDASSDAKQTKISVDLVVVDVAIQSGTTSRLEHKWPTATIGTGGAAYRLFVEAYHTTNSEEDDFLFQWAPASTGPWTTLITVIKTADDNVAQSAVLPSSVAGSSIWIRVLDTNRTANGTVQDTISVDHVYIRRYIPTPNFQTIATGGVVRDLGVADMGGDGHADIVVASGSNVVIYNGPSWATRRTLAAGGVVNEVEIAEINGDGAPDIIAATDGSDIYTWLNGVWTQTALADLAAEGLGKPISMRAGDVNDDGWDDFVVATDSGKCLLYMHAKGATWVRSSPVVLTAPMWGLDIGDIDRGVLVSYPG